MNGPIKNNLVCFVCYVADDQSNIPRTSAIYLTGILAEVMNLFNPELRIGEILNNSEIVEKF